MADAITYVGAGASSTANGVTPTPADPAGLATNDLKVAAFYSREDVDGTVAINAAQAWTELYNERTNGGLMGIWYRFHQPGDATPTFTLGGHAGGDDCIAQIAAWRGINPTTPIDKTGVLTTHGTTQNIGAPIPGIQIGRKALVICVGGKMDDWSSVATLDDDGDIGWAEIGEPDSTAGSDAGMVWDYLINTGLELSIAGKTFTVSGGASARGKGVLFSFALDAPIFSIGTHLTLYCAEYHPQNDNGQVGGAIDPLRQLVFTDLAGDDDIEVLSDSALDTFIAVTVVGRTSAEVEVRESKLLNGTTPVVFSIAGVMGRVEKVEKSGATIGTVTVRRSPTGATIKTIPPTEIGFRRLFAYAYRSTSAAKDYYEKGFLKDTHPTKTFQNGSVSENADPEGVITFTFSASQDDSGTVASRLTVPATSITNPDVFDGAAKSIPGATGLAPDSAIGIWFKMATLTNETPFDASYTLNISGGVMP